MSENENDQLLERLRDNAISAVTRAGTPEAALASDFLVLDHRLSKGQAPPSQWSGESEEETPEPEGHGQVGRPVMRTKVVDHRVYAPGVSCYAAGCGCEAGRAANRERARKYRMKKATKARRDGA